MGKSFFSLPDRKAVTGAALAPAACAVWTVCVSSQPAGAATAAGSIIRNEARASYEYQGATTSVVSNAVELRVDELLDVALVSLAASPVPATSVELAVPFRLTNAGNGSEAWDIVADTASGGDFTPLFRAIAIDSNDNGRYDAGSDAVLPAGGRTSLLAAENGFRVFALIDIPTGLEDGMRAEIRLSARSATGSGRPGTAFAGAGDGGSDALVGATGASASGLATIAAVRSSVLLEKTYAITDPFGGQRPIRGARVRYTLVARAVGTSPVANVVLSDAIPEGAQYLPGTLTLDGSALSDGPDADPGQAGARGIVVNLAAPSPGARHTVTFDTLVS